VPGGKFPTYVPEFFQVSCFAVFCVFSTKANVASLAFVGQIFITFFLFIRKAVKLFSDRVGLVDELHVNAEVLNRKESKISQCITNDAYKTIPVIGRALLEGF